MDEKDKPLTTEMDKPLLKPKVIAVPSTKRKNIKRDIIAVLLCTVLFVALAGVSIASVLKYIEMSAKITNLTEQVEHKDKARAEAVYRVVALTEQKETLEEKLVNLKNKEDLAKRDLEAYILKKFRVVPKVVAHEMAVQTVKLTKEYGVPFSLIVGLMEVESQFKPWAISKKDARGPMQVMPFWVKKKKSINLEINSKYDLHDVPTGITAGIKVFKYHLKEANNDINQGLYLYVGKDRTYANKVFNAMGRFEIFRSTLDTTLRSEEIKEVSKGPAKKDA